MRKLLTLLLVLMLSFALWSCSAFSSCSEHVDADGDQFCDNCNAEIECDHVDTTTDGVYECDKCGSKMVCETHVNENDDNRCDECGVAIPCETHIDKNEDNDCDRCYKFVPCKNHTDEDNDYICDKKCQADIDCDGHVDEDNDNYCDLCSSKLACTEAKHIDANKDLTCDKCGGAIQCKNHVDANKNLKCDICNEDLECLAHEDSDNDGSCDICGDDGGHVHDYSQTWSKDETKHWHAPTCGHNIPGADEAAHVDDDNNGICDVCKYTMCQHPEVDESSETWLSDASGHWHPLVCGHNVKPDSSKISSHSFGLDNLCSVCGYEENHEHTFETEWSYTTTEHYHKASCRHTTEESDRAAHVDVAPYDGICDTCEYVMCDHPYNDWSYNNDEHWREPTCDHVPETGRGAHADSDNDGICDTCSWNYDHEHTYEWIIDADGHRLNATCGHVLSDNKAGAHIDENNDIICDVCGYNYGHEHTFSSEWSSDGTHHWHAVTGECASAHPDVKDSYASHSDLDNNPFKCDVCGTPCEPTLPPQSDDVIETPKLEIPSNS